MKAEYKKYYEQFGLNVVYYRKKKRLTQLKLAELVDIDRSHISAIELGNVGVSFGLEYSFAQLPDMSKAVCSITMLVGRLEIFTYLAMLQASFWRENNW